MSTRLSVNIDHVATLRQARGTRYPDPVEAARAAEGAGATGITVHLRGDRRHIQDRDLAELREIVVGKLNLEMAATDEMVEIAARHRPDQVTLVPERPEEVTTEGGLDLLTAGTRTLEVAARLAGEGLAVSLFLDPDRRQIDWLATRAEAAIEGFELNTDRYARAATKDRATELASLTSAAEAGRDLGLRVYAGHALTTQNVGPVAGIPAIEELNIGHYLVSRAVIVGMAAAVQEMLRAMAAGRT